uniref:Beta-defensin-like domain-containing protein n=1 Tax=Gopherus agassizii TaxID=38772 RepID=A0A452GQM8_9SAUR
MKILYLLFALFFLVLQSSLGFTQFINNPISCSRAGGFCNHTCYPTYRYIGTCNFLRSCCRRRVSSGCHKGDVTVQTEYLCLSFLQLLFNELADSEHMAQP